MEEQATTQLTEAEKAIHDKCNQVETPLNEEEKQMDFSQMDELDLGEAQNYKTRLVQMRWKQQREQWLKYGTADQRESKEDPKMGVPSEEFPELGDASMAAVRKAAKRTMKSTTSPYSPFTAFYPLESIIDTYMEIWYRDDSDSSSS